MPLEIRIDLCYPKRGGDFMANHARYIIMIATMVAFIFIGIEEGYTAPKVQVDQAVYDAGSVSEGKDISHEFILKNSSDKTISFKIKPC
jgi:hypothetical protein